MLVLAWTGRVNGGRVLVLPVHRLHVPEEATVSARPNCLKRASTAMVAAIAIAVVAAAPGLAAGHEPNPAKGAAREQIDKHARDFATPRSATANPNRREKGDALEVADRAEQYANQRSAPGLSVSAEALVAARRQVDEMPKAKAKVAEVTNQPYNAEPAGYADPYWSNVGSGFGIVSGRVTALASDKRFLYAGAADGGVWRSANGGKSWDSVWDGQATLSIGALSVTADDALWVGTGEANTNADSYRGTGVYRSTNQGAAFTQVGGSQLVNSQIYRLMPDGQGWMYAATSVGLYRHLQSTDAGDWQLVLKPDPNLGKSPYLTSMMTDVAIRPGTHGQTVVAADGWRNGTAYNGFYVSTTGGALGSFAKAELTGDIDATDIGRTTFAYSGDGSRLYAIVESPRLLLAGEATNLQGVFVSKSGNPAGPWTKIADSAKLGASGSALKDLPGYHVGVQSWYNQALAVDSADPMRVYVSLEEVFQTTDGGATFTTASPYWNYGLACGTTCPQTTHPDQHALLLNGDGNIVIGNDGGVYQRPTSVTGYGHWANLNADLRTLQYYDARNGQLNQDGKKSERQDGLAYWGGLQDNGTSLLLPRARTNVEPAGGDGGIVIVDPKNANRSVGEYVNLTMYRTSDGGHTFTTISPECGYYNGSDCDPAARFIAPFVADPSNVDHWVAGGSKVWETTKGWNTSCAGATCDWVAVHSLGVGAGGSPNVATALATKGSTTYAGWVGGGGNPGPAFASGIDTNYGGAWHRLSSPILPNRYLAGLTVDPANTAHVYAIYNGYSRRWINGAGEGVVFESTDGGSTWRNISGNLPDAPGDALALSNGQLILATDVGMFLSRAENPERWSHVDGLPNASVNNVSPSADGDGVVAATHGRGIWQVRLKQVDG